MLDALLMISVQMGVTGALTEQEVEACRAVLLDGASPVAAHIAADANVSSRWGEYAWRAISATIDGAPHALPRLSVWTEGNVVELELAD